MTDGTQVGCCGSGKSSRCAGDDAKTRDLDLNEWAGKMLSFTVRMEAYVWCRLVQDVCGQGGGVRARLRIGMGILDFLGLA